MTEFTIVEVQAPIDASLEIFDVIAVIDLVCQSMKSILTDHQQSRFLVAEKELLRIINDSVLAKIANKTYTQPYRLYATPEQRRVIETGFGFMQALMQNFREIHFVSPEETEYLRSKAKHILCMVSSMKLLIGWMYDSKNLRF